MRPSRHAYLVRFGIWPVTGSVPADLSFYRAAGNMGDGSGHRGQLGGRWAVREEAWNLDLDSPVV